MHENHIEPAELKFQTGVYGMPNRLEPNHQGAVFIVCFFAALNVRCPQVQTGASTVKDLDVTKITHFLL
jgi:hypothetical protein